jgi:hypothetical protein
LNVVSAAIFVAMVRHCGSPAARTRSHCVTYASRITTYESTPMRKSSSASRGTPAARPRQPAIITSINRRYGTSSQSNTFANHVNPIHAHQIAPNTNRYEMSPSAAWPAASPCSSTFAACATATTNDRSNSSSSQEA